MDAECLGGAHLAYIKELAKEKKIVMTSISYWIAKVRDWKAGIIIPTNQGNRTMPCRVLAAWYDNDILEDAEGYSIMVYHEGQWLKAYNIDFE